MFRRNNGSQISPCIISQVRFALGLKTNKVNNSKSCSNVYWNEAVEIIGRYYTLSRQRINTAKR
jgi:hypothetical protein